MSTLSFLLRAFLLTCAALAIPAAASGPPRTPDAIFDDLWARARLVAPGLQANLRWAPASQWKADGESQAFESAPAPGEAGFAVWALEGWGRRASADELAFVFAHEIAHGLCGHRAKTVGVYSERSQAVGLGLDRLAEAAAHDTGFAFARQRADAAMELEADRVGAALAADAGYRPREGAQAALGAGPQGFGHPEIAPRLAAVDEGAAQDLAWLIRSCQTREPGAY